MGWGDYFFRPKKRRDIRHLKDVLNRFRELIGLNNTALELIADMGEKLSGDYVFDSQYLRQVTADLEKAVQGVVHNLNAMSEGRYPKLLDAFETARAGVRAELDGRRAVPGAGFVIRLDEASQDLSDATGEKMATLGELGRLGLKVPDGFVVTTHACRTFLESNGIDAERAIEELSSLAGEPLEKASDAIRERIRKGIPPPLLRKSVQEALSRLGKGRTLAVRSSALGEDGTLSFAGLYGTVLNVAPPRFFEAYQEVLSGLFGPQVVSYRAKQPRVAGAAPKETGMAVGCMTMVPARAGGVCYSLNPSSPERECIVISASWGLGKLVVEGEGGVDQFELARTAPHQVVSRRIARKERQCVLSRAGGVALEPVPAERQAVPCMSDEALSRLARIVVKTEAYFRRFQDVEWALDEAGEIHVLQARPLRILLGKDRCRADVASAVGRYPVLLQGRGVVACRGIAAGAVFHVAREEDMRRFPAGAVLVAKHTSPRLSRLVCEASAIVTGVGAVTGHLATVAREFRTPAIVDTGTATRVLKPGMRVTVDAEENIVYEGVVPELIRAQLCVADPYEDAVEFRLLRRLLRRIAPLHLTTPDSGDFRPESCTTYHDVIRFAHEMAATEIATSLDAGRAGGELPAVKLDLPIPLDLTVVDIGEGLNAAAAGKAKARLEEVACAPLRIMLESLLEPGVWHSEPVDIDFGGFMSSLTRTAAMDAASMGSAGRNIAIVSANYMNLNLHLGYHFNMVDVYLSGVRNENYIYFRFLGGVTDITRRSRRARLLADILERNDFTVEMKGDLVVSRTKKMSTEEMEHRLRVLGYLVGFTRQLDVLLQTEEKVDEYVELFEDRFLARKRDREEGSA
ncbi:MAG: pyruvate, water dikinase [Elusimicrobia bacterium]|nr:pyruvate, water dikinase [Elusimicrobiota bacterium]